MHYQQTSSAPQMYLEEVASKYDFVVFNLRDALILISNFN